MSSERLIDDEGHAQWVRLSRELERRRDQETARQRRIEQQTLEREADDRRRKELLIPGTPGSSAAESSGGGGRKLPDGRADVTVWEQVERERQRDQARRESMEAEERHRVFMPAGSMAASDVSCESLTGLSAREASISFARFLRANWARIIAGDSLLRGAISPIAGCSPAQLRECLSIYFGRRPDLSPRRDETWRWVGRLAYQLTLALDWPLVYACVRFPDLVEAERWLRERGKGEYEG